MPRAVAGLGELPVLPDPSTATDLGGEARRYVASSRETIKAWHDEGASGTHVVEALTTSVDRLIEWLFVAGTERYRRRYVQLDQRCVVFAQGGYGRGELNPHSDIDLLCVYPHKITPYTETITETVLYALWDARLTVGHAVRSVRDCVRIAATDVKVKTALIDARFVCGDRELARELDRALEREILPRAAARFFRDKLREIEARHQQYGDSVYLLEPQIKEGRGGLRDLHTALWIAKIKYKIKSMRELAVKGVMNSQELAEIDAARDFLFRVRNALHFLTGGHQDQLTFELQETVAENLGYRGGEGDPLKPVEHFLRDYYLHAAVVSRFAATVIDRAVNPPGAVRLIGRMMARTLRPGVRVVGGELTVSEENFFADRPIELVRIFVEAQRHAVTLSPGLAEQIRVHAPLLGEVERADPALVDAFLTILRSPHRVYETLHEMHKVGVLAQVLPEWAHLRCLALHDLYHIYTVDEHSLMGIRELERLRSGRRAESLPLLTELMRQVDKVELLFLGMMLHDVGKGLGGGHSEKGAAFSRDIAARLALNEDDSRELEFLVRHHLLLSHVAQRRDIHDEKLVGELARMVGSLEALKRLYLLTYADMRATGPTVWNNWRGSLLDETYLRVQEAITVGFEPEDRAARIGRIRDRVLAGVEAERGTEARQEVRRFLDTMPDSYFLTTPELLLPAHADLVRRARAEGLATSVVHYPEREFSEFTAALPDRPGLFATLTGVLTASGMNIVGARIATSSDHVALDAFRVSHLERRQIALDDDRWASAGRLLAEVLAGEKDLGAILARAARPGILDRPRRRSGLLDVVVNNETSDHYTVIDVHGQDRMGLLYGLARTLFSLGLEIHLAKISTAVDQVLDVFYVTEANGRKTERVAEIREGLLAVLEPDREEQPPEASLEAPGASPG